MFKPKQRYVQPGQDPVVLIWTRAEQDFMRGEPLLERDVTGRIGPVYTPAFDLFETADQYTLLGDLPGLGLNDLDIEFSGDSLTIIGERDGDDPAMDADCHAMERTFGSFVRRFELKRVDPSRSLARMANGVLLVEVPKRRESAGPGG
jgi:HSP20 family protein